ncbi:heme-binding protein [Erwinia sp. HDF1-3R]|uniref:GlcG/HbpS family heme-binding protein n=1 Tax=Erwinia sp. HDF1-3R TaxID=3141543 RepID=UPI0031F4EF79
MIVKNNIDLNEARRLMDIAIDKAKDIASPSNIAIVDASGFLISHIRMDGAQLPSIEHAINKAYTSALFGKATQELKKDAEPGGELYGVNNTLNGRVIVFAGGNPLIVNEQVVGAIGISGGTSEQDRAIADYAVAQFRLNDAASQQG